MLYLLTHVPAVITSPSKVTVTALQLSLAVTLVMSGSGTSLAHIARFIAAHIDGLPGLGPAIGSGAGARRGHVADFHHRRGRRAVVGRGGRRKQRRIRKVNGRIGSRRADEQRNEVVDRDG